MASLSWPRLLLKNFSLHCHSWRSLLNFMDHFYRFPLYVHCTKYEVLPGWYFQQEESPNSRTLHPVSESTFELLT